MSEFRKFQDDVMVDEALQDQLDTLIANPDFNDESLIEFAEQNGYQIMQEELDGVVETISNELLEDVVGGTGAAGSQLDQDWPGAGKVQEMNQGFNLEYLNLQQEMQGENRKFTTLSNIMKTKHDTAKATINNVR